jgi:UDP-N-acetyl-D-galactosamine dehydrogenase
VDLVRELRPLVGQVVVYDPLADVAGVRAEYDLETGQTLPEGKFDAIVLAVRHDEITRLGAKRLRSMLVPRGVIYDLKQVLPVEASDARL